MTESFVIEGGRPLNGRVAVAGNKNGALPILARLDLSKTKPQALVLALILMVLVGLYFRFAGRPTGDQR